MPIIVTSIILLIFLILALYAIINKLNFSYFLIALCLIVGALSYQTRNIPDKNDISNYVDKGYLTITGMVDNTPKEKNGKISFPLKAETPGKGKVYVSLQGSLNDLQYGDRIEVRGVISQSDQYVNPLMPEGKKIYFLSSYYCKKLSSGGGSELKRLSLWLSFHFNRVLNLVLPQKEASLLGSILLGSSVSPLPSEMQETYRQAGLIHLLVVSGTQVSILIGVCLGITRGVGLPLWLAVVVTSFLNLLLVVMTGAGASILRAAIMGETALVGLLFERQKEVYTALALSALILLIVDPMTLFDIGFQLSFLATWALVYIAPVLQQKLPQLLAISLAPIIATAPVIALNFNQITPGAVISNLLVLPWVEFLVILGCLTTLLGFIFLPLAQILGNTIWLMLTILDKIAGFVAAMPGACFYIGVPSIPLVAAYYVGLISLIELRSVRFRLALIGLIIIFVITWQGALAPASLGGGEMVVTFIDVGQGDSVLIETPEGKKVLIDGGGIDGTKEIEEDKIGSKVVVPFLRKKGINKLDLVVLTHPHADHLGGLNVVLDKIKVDQVLDSGQTYASEAYKRFRMLIKANKIRYSIAKAGGILSFGQNIKGYILSPINPMLGDTNSDSIVMRLVYGDISFLFTGDLEKEGEERVLQSTFHNPHSTFLKVGHHGSSTSTSDEFLKAVRPKYAVISVGKHNRYRHPFPGTLKKLDCTGIKYYRTDDDGGVVVRTNGHELQVLPRK
ncbi:MAG: DNA internalization-related competence protein ComEC/Rec2 [Candidatus Margulisbacteria bacterium]|nr:DNA internalization-related competence protein ComEC/Rec2 [Candidatus Margulisiibacteriota bacterium]